MLNGRTRISPARKLSMNALDLVSADPMRGELFLAGSYRVLSKDVGSLHSNCIRFVLISFICCCSQQRKSWMSGMSLFCDISPIRWWWWWWWYYPTPSEGWGRGGTPRRPNSRATPQGLDHRSRIEREEPKIDLRRGSEAEQSRRR